MKRLEPSATVAISAQAQQMRKEGIYIHNFSTGDPILENHPVILKAAQETLDQKMSPYAPVAGLTELRQAAADWMNHRFQAHYGVSQTLVTCGGKFGIYAALQVLLEPGDEVLFPAPYWVSYPEMTRLAQGVPKVIPTSEETHWKMTPQDLRDHLSKKSKILIFNNPSNPTGALYTKKEIEALLAVAKEANLIVIADEVYSELVFDGAKFVSCGAFSEHRDRVIVIESCSKNFAMAGWRVGFAFGPTEIIAEMTSLQSQCTTGTSFLSQKAALGALLHANEVSSYVRHTMDKRRKLFFQTYNRLFQTSLTPPSAAIYCFVKMGGKDSIKTCADILAKTHVVLIPGIAFGMEGYVRFAFSEEEADIVKGLEALRDSL